MSELIVKTVQDLHWGRLSWRIRLLLVIPAFAAGVAAGALR